jgi:hypothetical protein
MEEKLRRSRLGCMPDSEDACPTRVNGRPNACLRVGDADGGRECMLKDACLGRAEI